jgi:hypothetical protein
MKQVTFACGEPAASAYPVAMTKPHSLKTAKVVPITEGKHLLIATDEKTKRFILAVGTQRVAFDFHTRITELPARTEGQPARVLSMDKHRTSKSVKQP